MKSTVLSCLLAAAVLVAGCSTVDREKKTQALEAASTAYGKALRWGYYETAYGYLHPDLHTEVPEALENVRVTSYEVAQPAVLKGETQAEQVVQIEYVLRDEQVVRKVLDRQDWRFDDKTKTWWLHSPVPAFP